MDVMNMTEHQKFRGHKDRDEDFVETMKGDQDLMDDDLMDEADKDNIIIEPIIEAKPRTKLSFIAPRIPVNRAGFGVQNTATKAELNIKAGKSAGGIKINAIAPGAHAVGVSAAFSGNDALKEVNMHDQAAHLQETMAMGLTGISEIQASLEERKKEQQMLNLKSGENRLLGNSKKISNILDSFKQFQLKRLGG